MAEMLGIALRGRQLDPEGGAAARGLPRPDRTLILLDQGRGDRQAQARAAALTGRARAGLIGAVEALEDLLTLLLVQARPVIAHLDQQGDRKSTRLNSSHVAISYAVFCLKKKTTTL